jgi:NAD(P)-dependent dehydrogenase (short-subunit alcohol dehydrogenase family)
LNGFPTFDLRGQVALVTGAARGLGNPISLALAHAGADVALGLRDVHAQGSLPAQIEAMGRQVIPLQMDMRHLDQIFQAVDDTVRHLGRIDILVNNAGLAPDNLAENVREEDFDLTLAVNVKGTFFASQAAGRVMIRQKSGHPRPGWSAGVHRSGSGCHGAPNVGRKIPRASGIRAGCHGCDESARQDCAG